VALMPHEERHRRVWIVIVFVVAYFVSYFYRSTNAVIADDLIRDIGIGAGALGLMTSVFFLTFAAVQLPLGSALDRFGARWVTPALLLAAVVGSLVFASATTLTGLTIGRGLIGVGMAGVLMGALKAFSAWFEPRAFATVSGLLVGVGSLGALAAATPLALVTEAFGWRAAFVGGAVVTLAAAAAIALVVREPRTRGAVAAQGGADRLADVFRSASFWRLAGLAFALAGILFAYQGLWAGPYLTQRLGASPVEAGNVLLALGLATSLGFLCAGPLANRFGLARTAGSGCALLVAALAALLVVDPTWPRWAVTAVFALLGLAGSANVLTFALARASFPTMPGRAVTAVNLFGIGGGALVQWGLGGVIGRYAPTASGAAPDAAFTAAVAVSLGVAVLALVGFAPLMRPSPHAERA
jgi:predicted MFS family arabinose efflux permease